MTASAKVLPLGGGRRMVPCQSRLLRAPPAARNLACVGGFGSGKTVSGAIAMAQVIAANPWTPAYGDGDYPLSVVVGPTHKVLKDSAYRTLMSIMPRSLVRREWKSPEWVIEWANGHRTILRTLKGAFEGANVCGLWCDEASKITDALAFQNLMARVREPRSDYRRFILTGLPESGVVRDLVEPREVDRDPAWHVVHARTQDNPYLPAGYLDSLRRTVSAQEARAYFEGEWMSRPDVALYEYDPAVHLTDDRGDRSKPVHVGLDVGTRGAIVILQEKRVHLKDHTGKLRYDKGSPVVDLGLHVVDEMLPERQSVREAVRALKARGWQIVPHKSKVYSDPNTDQDELDAIESQLPGVEVVVQTRKAEQYYVAPGLRAINCALKDADGNVRLTINRHLPREPRSLLTAITSYKADAGGRWYTKDNRTDHAIDALRMVVADLLPVTTGPAVQIVSRRAG